MEFIAAKLIVTDLDTIEKKLAKSRKQVKSGDMKITARQPFVKRSVPLLTADRRREVLSLKMHPEGRNYVVRDGDCIVFRFNV